MPLEYMIVGAALVLAGGFAFMLLSVIVSFIIMTANQ